MEVNMNTLSYKRQKRSLAFIVAATLIITTVFAGAGFGSAKDADAYAANPTPYPWSERSATLDYIDDVYDGISGPSVFEDVTAERLFDILSSAGDYYILFGGPQNESTQTIIADIAREAGEATNDISKIYHFNPLLDGYQLDVTKDTEVGTWEGGSRGVGQPVEKLHDVWTDILALLPPTVDAAITSYDSDDTLLFRFHKNNHTDPVSATAVPATYTFKDSDVSGYSSTAEDTDIAAVFGPTSSVRSDYDFFKRLYNGNAAFFNLNGGAGATGNRTGQAEVLFSDAVFGPGGDGFKLHQVTPQELWNVLNAPGDRTVLFASAPCHNTQAIIGKIAERAKSSGYAETIYVYDPALGGATIWGEGNEIDTVKFSSATGGLYTRNQTYNFSYIYANIVKYFGQFTTENNTKHSNRINYYPNGDTAQPKTTAEPWSDAPAESKAAIRLQVPFIVGYNKGAAAPVTKQWIHQKNDLSAYSEYMLDLSFVLGTDLAKAIPIRDGSAGNDSVDTDGMQAVDFAAEAVAALDNIFTNNTVTFQFSPAPDPVITGDAKVGGALTLDAGKWGQSPTFKYQWLADGQPIAGASGETYNPVTADIGKKITATVTASRVGYAEVTKTSAATNAVAANAFTSAPVPQITGSAKVGATLGLKTGSWSPWPTGAKFAYQWYANGKAIKGATKNKYKVAKADVDKKLTVAVTATAPGYAKTTKTSKATTKIIGSKFKKKPTPKITGTAKVGKKLKAKPGAWSPKAKYTYQWYANGKAIKGATKATLTLKKAQKGKKITVKVTAKKSGYNAVTKTSKATKKVK
jgi:hypothetical protein